MSQTVNRERRNAGGFTDTPQSTQYNTLIYLWIGDGNVSNLQVLASIQPDFLSQSCLLQLVSRWLGRTSPAVSFCREAIHRISFCEWESTSLFSSGTAGD